MSILVEEIISRLDQLTPDDLKELNETLAARAKPGKESLRLTHVIEATRWQTFSKRTGKAARKTLFLVFMLATLGAAAFLSVYFLRTETVATGSRIDQFQTRIRYTVEQARYRDISKVIFDDGGDGQVVCDLSPMKVDRLVEERWLAGGRAIYLNLSFKSPEALGADGRAESKPAKLVYDFHRGELYLTSPLHLWRTASSESHWMNEEEFAGLLARFTQ